MLRALETMPGARHKMLEGSVFTLERRKLRNTIFKCYSCEEEVMHEIYFSKRIGAQSEEMSRGGQKEISRKEGGDF